MIFYSAARTGNEWTNQEKGNNPLILNKELQTFGKETQNMPDLFNCLVIKIHIYFKINSQYRWGYIMTNTLLSGWGGIHYCGLSWQDVFLNFKKFYFDSIVPIIEMTLRNERLTCKNYSWDFIKAKQWNLNGQE